MGPFAFRVQSRCREVLRNIIVSSLTLSFLTLSGCSREQGPVETTQEALAVATSDSPEKLWDFLPESYQSQLNNGVRGLGTKIDPEMYDAVFDFAGYVADRVEVNRKAILARPDFIDLNADESARARILDSAVSLVRTLKQSEIGSAKRIKSANGKAFMKQVAPVATHLMDSFSLPLSRIEMKAVKVTLDKVEGDTATVILKIDGEPNRRGERTTLDLVKVEGKWIPKLLKVNWPQAMSGLASVALQAQGLNVHKPQVIPALTLARGTVDSVLISGALPQIDMQKLIQAGASKFEVFNQL